MCIIVAKPKGIAMPSMETLKNCFTRNPDGAGIMYSSNSKVHIKKGFMTFPEFKNEIEQLATTLNLTDTSVVMHFRITTHGKTNRENCHPFPLSSRLSDLHNQNLTCRVGIAHNGIISSMGKYSNDKESDTMAFIRHVAYPLLKDKQGNLSKNIETLDILQALSNGRLAFLDWQGNLQIEGQWEQDNGIYYSNTSFKPYSYGTVSCYPYYSCYDDYCDSFGWEYSPQYQQYQRKSPSKEKPKSKNTKTKDKNLYLIPEGTWYFSEAFTEYEELIDGTYFTDLDGNIYEYFNNQLEFFDYAPNMTLRNGSPYRATLNQTFKAWKSQNNK